MTRERGFLDGGALPTKEGSEKKSRIPESLESGIEQKEQKGHIPTFTEQLQRGLDLLSERETQVNRKKEFPRVGFTAGGSAIEHQQMHLTQRNDSLTVSFKLTESAYAQVLPRIAALGKETRGKWFGKEERARWPSAETAYAFPYDAHLLKEDGLDISVGAEVSDFEKWFAKATPGPNAVSPFASTRSYDRLVSIEIPKEGEEDVKAETIAKQIEDVLKNVFELGKDAMPLSPEDAQRETLKEAASHLKQESDELTEKDTEGITRKEVFPGTFAPVKEGRSKELMQDSPYAVYHRVSSDPKCVAAILKSDGLISSTERMQRGIVIDGSSAFNDIQTGGGDFVFGRITTENSAKRVTFDRARDAINNGFYFVLSPEVMDRMDWHLYYSDKYGTVQPNQFDARPAPKEVFEKMQTSIPTRNEIMFRGGIPKHQLAGIFSRSSEACRKLVEELRASGITEVNGQPIETFVRVGSKKEMVNLSQETANQTHV